MNSFVTSSSPADTSGAVGVDREAVGPKQYRVFLSYSHADTTWARWLMRRLEGYRVPERFHGRAAPIGEVGARIAPVFRDRDELPTADDLGEAVQGALRQSATLVVIGSTTAARSRWVNEEVMYFKRIGRADRIFALIVDGEPNAADEAEECFPPGLRFQVGSAGVLKEKPVELIAADARAHGDGKDDAFIRLVAGLLGVGFDELRQREMQRRHRRMFWVTASSLAGMAITLGLAVLALRARDDAQRRQENSELVMAQMLEDLETRLKKADQLGALDDVAKKVMAYFKSLDPRDLTDRSNAQQAKLFTQIGQIYLARLRYADATESFTAAFDRASGLVTRHPRDGEILFERAQAEYWLGYVPYQQGQYAEAGAWWRRYRDSGVALTGLDPALPRWQREAVSGHHNLAALELKRGDLAAARQGFLGEREAHERLLAMLPDDAELQASIANVDSYLGSIAERAGDLTEAVARFGAQVARLEVQVKADALSARMKQRLATALGLQSDALAIAGQQAAALERRRRAMEIFEALTAQDATNRDWQVSAQTARLKYALLLRAQGDAAVAGRLVREGRAALEQLAKSGTSNRAITSALALASRLVAQLSDAAGEPGAGEAAERAVAAAQALLALDRADENHLNSVASAHITAGVIAQRAGDSESARRHFQAALATVEERARTSTNARVLDPAARALMLLGRAEAGRAVQERLARLGYQPLEPWPGISGVKTLSAEVQH